MTIFNNVTNYYETSKEFLLPTLIKRDSSGLFDKTIFNLFSTKGLFEKTFENHPTDLNVLQKYYDIARGSLDLPFTSSLAAHGFVGAFVFKEFAGPELYERFFKEIESGTKICAITNSEHGTSMNLKQMRSRFNRTGDCIALEIKKPCITNGGIADLLFTTIWNNHNLEIYLLLSPEVNQKPISSKLSGFRTGDSGSVEGLFALPDIDSRKLADGKQTLKTLRYTFFLERLVVTTMATGLAHGLEDYIFEVKPSSLEDASKNSKQYIQEKLLNLHMTRIKMTSLIETIINRGNRAFNESDAELSILKLIISNELRESVYNCIEMLGHKSLMANSILSKILRDVQMCSFFGGTQELQKASLFSMLEQKIINTPKQTLEVS